MKKTTLVLLGLIFVFSQYRLQAQIAAFEVKDLPVKYLDGNKRIISLVMIYNGDLMRIDSAIARAEGTMWFDMKNKPGGLYRVMLGPDPYNDFNRTGDEQYFDFIYSGKPVNARTDFYYPLDSMVVKMDETNLEYYSFLKTWSASQTKIMMLEQMLNAWSYPGKIRKEMSKEFNRLLAQQKKYAEKLEEKHKGTLLGTIIHSSKNPDLKPDYDPWTRQAVILDYMTGSLDYADTFLLYTEYVPKRILNYLKIIIPENATPDILDSCYKQAADLFIPRAAANKRVQNLVIKTFIDNLDQMGRDEVMEYIYSRYVVAGLCPDDALGKEIMKRVEGNEKLKTGNTAPDILFNLPNGSETSLRVADGKYKVVIFWSSGCSHCNRELPALKKLYDTLNKAYVEKKTNEPLLTVFAVSLDKSFEDYQSFIRNGSYNWWNYCDLMSWDGSIVNDYYVYATPFIFLLDNQLKILLKPRTVAELKEWLSAH